MARRRPSRPANPKNKRRPPDLTVRGLLRLRDRLKNHKKGPVRNPYERGRYFQISINPLSSAGYFPLSKFLFSCIKSYVHGNRAAAVLLPTISHHGFSHCELIVCLPSRYGLHFELYIKSWGLKMRHLLGGLCRSFRMRRFDLRRPP